MRTGRPRTVFRIKLAPEDAERLFAAARRRAVLPPERLIEALISIVLRESLVNAVIDDDPLQLPALPPQEAAE
jgi:hypothetical protein